MSAGVSCSVSRHAAIAFAVSPDIHPFSRVVWLHSQRWFRAT
jgi:hypothetical protein